MNIHNMQFLRLDDTVNIFHRPDFTGDIIIETSEGETIVDMDHILMITAEYLRHKYIADFMSMSRQDILGIENKDIG